MKDEHKNDAVDTRPDDTKGFVYDAEVVGETSGAKEDKYIGFRSIPVWASMLLIGGVYMVGMRLVYYIVHFIASIVSDGGSAGIDSGGVQLITYILCYPSIMIFAIWLLRKRGMTKPILSFSFKRADPLMILWGLLLMVATSIVAEPLLGMFPSESREIGAGGLMMLSMVVVAPVFEEMLFRGVIQEYTSRLYKPAAGILIASLFFGIAHSGSGAQSVIYAFLQGLILGYVYYRTRSLVAVIAMHVIHNGLTYAMSRMASGSADLTMRQLISSDVWYWIVYAVSAALFVFAMVKLWTQLNKVDKKAGQTK